MTETGLPDTDRAPTLEDVARAAGVSTATVSRCLNAPDRLRPETRARVMQAVNALGYAPNFGARALAAKRTGTIGAVIPTMDNAMFARGLQAFQEELHAQGATLLVASSQYDPGIEAQQVRTLVARGADALLLIGRDRPEATYRFLADRRVPAMIAWVHAPGAPLPSVGFDNFAAMKALAAHALAMGHRRIGCISAPTRGNDRARNRVEGLRAAMREAGLGPEALRIVENPYGIANGAEAFTRLMEAADPPTLVVCGNDVLAVGALEAARRKGIDVPGAVSITGFDDIELAEVATPPLTTVQVPHRAMGRQAAQLLLARLRGETTPDHIALATTLRLRGTLAPPPKEP